MGILAAFIKYLAAFIGMCLIAFCGAMLGIAVRKRKDAKEAETATGTSGGAEAQEEDRK